MSAPLDGELDRTWPSTGVSPAGPGLSLQAVCLADPVFAARYEGWDELGRGSRSHVLRTRVRGVGLPVAVKLVWGVDEAERARLQGETRLLASVTHPSLVRTFAAFDRGEFAWLEMELVEGTTLQAWLRARSERSEPTPLAEGLAIGACLAEALAAVHAAGIVHRDVKPSNVLLPSSGRPAAKLADFGIARSLDATQVLSEPVAGSPKYVCPEALSGRPVGVEGDVYALALTLYALFAGGLYPFALPVGAGVDAVLDCHRRKAPMPLRALKLGLPDSVVDIVHHGLAKDPRRRPSAEDVARVLRAAQAALVVPAAQGRRRPSSWTGRHHGARRLVVPVLALGMGVVAGVTAVVLALWLLSGV